jgi:RND family efflux transporter MFP subunit
MKSDPFRGSTRPVINVIVRIVVCSLILIVGLVGMKTLASLKKPPAEVDSDTPPQQVEVLKAVPEDVTVVITGYGEVEALNTVAVSPEVSGRVVYTHPRLEAGEVIAAGDVLFRIDPSDYRAAFLEAQASVGQLENALSRLKKQSAIDGLRLKTIRRNTELAKSEYERIRKLHRTGKVVSISSVETAEKQYNTAVDLADQLALTVDLYPLKIKESQNALTAAQARLALASARLSRCEVRAPFDGRVKSVSLETGQYVSPGPAVLTLADDSLMELKVSLDSRDARRWLLFNSNQPAGGTAWFSGLVPVDCPIRWTEDRQGHVWRGRLHRVVAFNNQNRTLTVAVRVEGKNAPSLNGNGLPLVEGMFCSVEIPGRTLHAVYRLPRWAVSFEKTVYVAVNSRLKTVPVSVARIQGEQTIVTGGIRPGDMVITTRLVDPLENARLAIKGPQPPSP